MVVVVQVVGVRLRKDGLRRLERFRQSSQFLKCPAGIPVWRTFC